MKGNLVVRAPTCSGSGIPGLLPSSLIHAPRTLFEPKCSQAPASVPCLWAEAAAVPTAREKQAARCEPAWYPGKEAKEMCGIDNVISPAQSSRRQEAMSLLPCLCTLPASFAEGAWLEHGAWEREASVFLCTCKESLGSNKQPKFTASLEETTGNDNTLLKPLPFSLLLGNMSSAFLVKLSLIPRRGDRLVPDRAGVTSRLAWPWCVGLGVKHRSRLRMYGSLAGKAAAPGKRWSMVCQESASATETPSNFHVCEPALWRNQWERAAHTLSCSL